MIKPIATSWNGLGDELGVAVVGKLRVGRANGLGEGVRTIIL